MNNKYFNTSSSNKSFSLLLCALYISVSFKSTVLCTVFYPYSSFLNETCFLFLTTFFFSGLLNIIPDVLKPDKDLDSLLRLLLSTVLFYKYSIFCFYSLNYRLSFFTASINITKCLNYVIE